MEDLRAIDQQQNIDLKRVYAWSMLIGLGVQVVTADSAFFFYGYAKRWQLTDGALQVWLAATVVQVIGIVYVISSYLFPRRENTTAP